MSPLTTPVNLTTASISEAILRWQIGESFFSSAIAWQTGIFAVIVTVLIGGFTIFTYFNIRRRVQTAVGAESSKTENKIEKVIDQKFKDLENNLRESYNKLESNVKTEINRHEMRLGILDAEVYRAMGAFMQSQNTNDSAFIWFLRSANSGIKANGEGDVARSVLRLATISLKKVDDGQSLLNNNSLMDDYQEMMPTIKNSKFKIEADLLEKEFNEALNRRPASIQPI